MTGPRVMQVMAGASQGGAEAFFTRLVPALARAGVEQRVVIRREPARAARLRAGHIDPVEFRFGGPLDVLTRLSLRAELRRYHPRIVLTWMSRATRAVPRGDFVHVGRLGGYYDLKYYRACDHLIANTGDLAAYLRRGGWPEDRVHVLPNFAEEPAAAPVSRATLATPADATVILGLGRLHPVKGFDLLIQAMASVPAATLWLAGDGPEQARLTALVRRLGIADRVRLLGWRDDAAALIGAADIVVVPSRHEPLGNVVIEAWAGRRPVVATASPGPASLIENGRTGLLVALDDPSVLAEALRRLAGDAGLRGRLAAGGRAAFEAGFTEKTVVGRYIDLFHRLAG